MDDGANLLNFLRPGGIVPALLVLAVTGVTVRVVAGTIERLGVQFTEWRLALQQTKAIVRLLIAFGGIAVATSFVIQLSGEAVLALAGTFAVAIGISLRDLIASIIAGITILVDRPFQVGDRVTYGDVYGEVKEIGLRTVRVVTLDDSVVTIPNNKFLTDVVISGNTGALDMLVQIDFLIGLDQDLDLAKSIVAEVLASSRFTYLKKPWSVVFAQTTVGNMMALRLRAKVYVLDIHYEEALISDVTERVMRAFNQQGIAAPNLRSRPV